MVTLCFSLRQRLQRRLMTRPRNRILPRKQHPQEQQPRRDGTDEDADGRHHCGELYRQGEAHSRREGAVEAPYPVVRRNF